MEDEKWYPIFNEDYFISSYGNCKNRYGRILKKRIRNRRVHYGLYVNKKIKYLLAHRLIALEIIPNPLNKPDINHIDGNPLNNYYKNLEWCTKKENTRHSYDSHLQCPRYKLTPCEEMYIRVFYNKKRGISPMLCKKFGISRRLLANIIKNKNRINRKYN